MRDNSNFGLRPTLRWAISLALYFQNHTLYIVFNNYYSNNTKSSSIIPSNYYNKLQSINLICLQKIIIKYLNMYL